MSLDADDTTFSFIYARMLTLTHSDSLIMMLMSLKKTNPDSLTSHVDVNTSRFTYVGMLTSTHLNSLTLGC